jgi:hypothetical protein
MSAAVYEGGCLCGAVRYRAQGASLGVEYCHCGMCRRASGAPVVVWADFPTERVTWLAGQPTWRRSSAGAERGFCAACGTALAFRGDRSPEQVSLSVGSLDDPARLAPQQHIYVAERLPWLAIADDLPRYERGTNR